MSTGTIPQAMHIGRKISRIRELRGMKQETLAQELGISQQAVSKLEQSEHLEDEKLEFVAKALGVSAETIKSFDEEKAINFISSTFNQSGLFNEGCTFNFNPIEKIIELYDALLKSEREKVELLQKMLDK
ncbi:MAG: helix-turn-helix domain-containing protein [Heyndrickxia sp.]